ncbi:MAG TPA: type II toxin-antitoxin system prevent-host-death family antitoxin [Edaphobacter sp.]|nr:type II toxin-antitoxin system prevent-host-death family antitoxin [Edaphobacter sp.]
MSITTVSGRQFLQNANGAKNAARNGPVFITDRGRPAHVLLSIEEYCHLIRCVSPMGIAELAGVSGEPSKLAEHLYQPASQS